MSKADRLSKLEMFAGSAGGDVSRCAACGGVDLTWAFKIMDVLDGVADLGMTVAEAEEAEALLDAAPETCTFCGSATLAGALRTPR